MDPSDHKKSEISRQPAKRNFITGKVGIYSPPVKESITEGRTEFGGREVQAVNTPKEGGRIR